MRAKTFYRPTSLEDAYSKWKENPNNVLLAGGLWLKKMGREYDTLIDLSSLKLDVITDDQNYVYVGSMTSLRSFEISSTIKAIGGGMLSFATSEIMGVNFRNCATIGGSIMGKFPFSDVICALLPFDVELTFYPKQTLTLEEFINQKGKIDGILVSLRIKKETSKGYFKKIKTTALDFPLINIAMIKRDDDIYLSVGSRPMIACLIKLSKFIQKDKMIEDVAKSIVEDLSFADSFNISEQYRKDLCRVYIRRFLEEVNS